MNITNIPAPRVPFIDERTGQISREWFRFLNNQFVLTGSGQTAITTADLELIPASTTDDYTAVLQAEIDALEVMPPRDQRVFADYGMFYDTTTQTAAAINTAYAVTFDSVAYERGVRRGTPTSRIVAGRAGIYNVAFSVQLDKTAGGTANVNVWGRKNGTNIAWSTSRFHIQGNNNEDIVTVNFFVDMADGDYFELMWSTDDTTVQLTAFPAAAPAPGIPSAILTVNQVNL